VIHLRTSLGCVQIFVYLEGLQPGRQEVVRNSRTREPGLELLVLFTFLRGETLCFFFLLLRSLNRHLLIELGFPGKEGLARNRCAPGLRFLRLITYDAVRRISHGGSERAAHL